MGVMPTLWMVSTMVCFMFVFLISMMNCNFPCINWRVFISVGMCLLVNWVFFHELVSSVCSLARFLSDAGPVLLVV